MLNMVISHKSLTNNSFDFSAMKQSSNALSSTLKCRCPRCRQGAMFINPNPYNIQDLFKMPQYCTECGKDLQPEPSFYTGAMFVNYGISVALVVSTFVAFNVLFKHPNVTYMIATAIGLAALFGPLFIRLSRSIWAHFFFKFDEKSVEKFQSGAYNA